MKTAFLVTLIAMASSYLAAEPDRPTADEVVRATMDRAERAFRRGAHDDAISAATTVIEAQPKNSKAYLLRAQVYEDLRQHAKAVADFNEVLKLEPRTANVYQHRGFEQFKLGYVTQAVADFDKFLEFIPAQAPYHWQRGIALYYAGRFADGRKQFESHQTVNPADVENAVWHYLCVARQEGIEKARQLLIDIRGDERIPMMQVHALFAGKGSADAVIKAAEAGQPSPPQLKGRLFYAHLYLGLYFEAAGNASLAEEHIANAAGPYAQDHYMGDVARVHLQLLRAKQKKG